VFGRSSQPSPRPPGKIVVSGGLGVARRPLSRHLGDRTDGQPRPMDRGFGVRRQHLRYPAKTTTTWRSTGRITLDEKSLVLYLSVPRAGSLRVPLDDLVEGAQGAIVLVDTGASKSLPVGGLLRGDG